MNKDPNASTDKTNLHRAYDHCVMILIILWPLMMIAALPVLSAIPTDVGMTTAPIRVSVNPNVAPWWELTVLPRVGETIAHAIVRYRESAVERSVTGPDTQVFRRPVDLSKIRGIGPKTLQRIGKYLHFDDN